MKPRIPRFHAFAVVLASAVLAVTFSSPAVAAKGKPTPPPGDSVPIVCLSPGHGGSDTGAVNGELTEKDLNWTIAGKLATLLSAENYGVVWSHLSKQENPSNTERAEACNAHGANTVLWIHLNASSDRTINYFQAFWGKKNKDEAFCQKLTDTFALSKPNSPELLDKKSVGQFASNVMLKANGPACLVENVFLTNTDEGTRFRLENETRTQEIADELYKGLVAWYSSR
jgi:N-acetylmuramoyl-L-alanine amidase